MSVWFIWFIYFCTRACVLAINFVPVGLHACSLLWCVQALARSPLNMLSLTSELFLLFVLHFLSTRSSRTSWHVCVLLLVRSRQCVSVRATPGCPWPRSTCSNSISFTYTHRSIRFGFSLQTIEKRFALRIEVCALRWGEAQGAPLFRHGALTGENFSYSHPVGVPWAGESA